MGSYEDTMLKLEKMAQANTATQMNWQERMTKSSHQMEVADLVKAGLNPVLSSGGNGAQGYTTSVDSAVNGIAGMASAREGANATRYAARQSAAATRAAAAAQLAAAKYAANMSYAANQYGWEQKSKIQEGINQTQLQIIDKTPPKNIAGLIYKAFDQSGIRKELVSSKLVNGITNAVKGIANNPIQFFKSQNQANINSRNFVLNSKGAKTVANQLAKLKISNTYNNQRLFIKAFVFHDGSAIRSIASMMKGKHNSASTLR